VSERPPLDLRALGDVDEPDVVRAALRSFRRRLWTRYLWIGLAIILGSVAWVVGNRPSNLKEEVEAADTITYPADAVWRIEGSSIALEEVADLGGTMGIHFVVIPDPGTVAPTLWVEGETHSMGWNTYDTYVEAAKTTDPVLTLTYGKGCVPSCERQQTLEIDLQRLHVPATTWRAAP
jgi:hypothetical protein